MQALQFLKGISQLPVQKDAASLSNRKESSVSSFKTILEDASQKEAPQKVLHTVENAAGDEVKNADVPKEAKEAAEVSQVKKGKQPEKESEQQEYTSSLPDNEKPLAAAQQSTLPAVTGEEVLFGQPVEQVAGKQLAVELEAGLEDVTVIETAYDSHSLPLEMGQEPELAAAGFLSAEAAQPAAADELASFSMELDRAGVPEEETARADQQPFNPSAAAFDAVAESAVSMQAQESSFGQTEAKAGDQSRQFQTEELQSLESTSKGSKFTIVDNRSIDAKREAAKEAPVELKAESVKQHGNTLDITFNLNQEQELAVTAEQNILSTSDQAAAGDASSFQRMLSNQLLNQAPEFVKAGSIILRDNDNGTINLNLKPEALGNVKITLHVTDKGIEGQIVVASKEAFEAFNQNMDNLKQSFRQSGFDAANLSLSLADGSAAQGDQLAQGNARGQQRSGEDFMATRTFGGLADGDEKISSATIAAAYGAGGHQIDVVA